ncbi:restriction endonuclease [Bradyrhizobium oligotrophicum]|uniref:restriction endonuclease n=1 Tax=Bradyrhizobium TaxID=374 RepID=UPI003EB75917
MLDRATQAIRNWVVGAFRKAIESSTRADDRTAIIQWLQQSRDVLASDRTQLHKSRELSAMIDSRAVLRGVAGSVTATVRNYRHASLPLPVKIAIPATLALSPVLGGQAVGIAALGGAIGLPALLLVFIGASGVTAIIEALARNPDARSDIAGIVGAIIADERLRRASAAFKATMRAQPATPEFSADMSDLAASLLAMTPFAFERHVMSFFEAAGLQAWVTPQSNDFGMDGGALHPNGLIVVQCKRNAPDNKVGRPVVQQFKGVIEEQGAYRGYVVTTSAFSEEAIQSAGMTDRIVLIGMADLVTWHHSNPTFD